MDDGIGLVEVLLGLPGFWVLDVVEDDDELVITIESMLSWAHCRTCGARAEPRDRMPVDVRDLACFGRPARLRVDPAQVALPGAVVFGADVDGDV
jgi:hypothetical protein